MKAEDLAGLLEKVKRTGQRRWMGCCPAHPDKSPSLAVAEGEDGRVLLHCFAGCGVAEIVGAMGLQLADIMPERPLGERMRPLRRPFPAADVLEALRTESTIVWIAAAQMAQGKTLTGEERARLNTAAARIEAAANA